MRVAVSGTHRVGKSTLVEALAEHLPGYRTFDEVYAQLEDEGHDFSDPPALEDFEVQLRAAIERAHALPRDAIVDRCPLDYVAYLLALDEDYDVEPWRDALAEAMAVFDLVVVIRIAARDPFVADSPDDARLRTRADEQMHRVITSDALGVSVESIEVEGAPTARVDQVLAAMRRS